LLAGVGRRGLVAKDAEGHQEEAAPILPYVLIPDRTLVQGLVPRSWSSIPALSQ
jgi:hypothetical protein